MSRRYLNSHYQGQQQRIALVETQPDTEQSTPGVLFCGGFNSTMEGSKALALERFCQQHGIAFTRFDYSGHGSSDGEFIEGNIDRWLSDTLCVFDQLDNAHKTVLVGSSMGAWIATLAALQRPAQTAGLITIAAAPDFTERLLQARLSDDQKTLLQRGQTLLMPSEYDDGSPYPISGQLIENSRAHCLLDGPVAVEVPVRMLHGTADTDVPYDLSVALMSAITSSDVQLTLVKDGDHRLSSPQHLMLLENTLLALL